MDGFLWRWQPKTWRSPSLHLCLLGRWILSSSHQDAESVSPTLQSDWAMWLALDHRIMETWLSRESKKTDVLCFAFSFWFLEPYTCPGLAYLMRDTRPCHPVCLVDPELADHQTRLWGHPRLLCCILNHQPSTHTWVSLAEISQVGPDPGMAQMSDPQN